MYIILIIESMNLQTHEPVKFKKTMKIEHNENTCKVFHSLWQR